LGLKDGDETDVEVEGERGIVFRKVWVRVHESFLSEFHVDVDEANACGLRRGIWCGYVCEPIHRRFISSSVIARPGEDLERILPPSETAGAPPRSGSARKGSDFLRPLRRKRESFRRNRQHTDRRDGGGVRGLPGDLYRSPTTNSLWNTCWLP
jgi:hypothetical protein